MGPGAYQFRGKLAKLNASLKRTERLTRRRHRQRFAGASSTWRWRRQVSSQDRRLPGRRTCQRAEDRRQGPRGCWVLGDGRVRPSSPTAGTGRSGDSVAPVDPEVSFRYFQHLTVLAIRCFGAFGGGLDTLSSCKRRTDKHCRQKHWRNKYETQKQNHQSLWFGIGLVVERLWRAHQCTHAPLAAWLISAASWVTKVGEQNCRSCNFPTDRRRFPSWVLKRSILPLNCGIFSPKFYFWIKFFPQGKI